MKNLEIFSSLFSLQNEINIKTIGVNWVEKNLKWEYEIFLEVAEAMESNTHKWWKEEKRDLENVKMELVDMLHFAISLAIKNEFTPQLLDSFLKKETWEQDTIPSVENINRMLFYIAQTCEDDTRIVIKHILDTWFVLGLSMNQLYLMYLGKNALNHFRQENGYKEGTYIKIWKKEEDNVHLLRIIQGMKATPNSFQKIKEELAKVYADLCLNNKK